ncbi:MAG TPA: glycosyltransferase family 2 protein [Acidimicrobiia bacterium]|jgi:cellulose synthase/poly-beta-1,6-N-acetylglucosamine synthase-like glycosyltransferase|nr:glycosyltransferase family 2 protein [Acidimicrobiia bacterium]
MNVLKNVLHWFDVFVIFYFVALNSGYLFLIALAGFDVGKTVRRVDFAGYDSIFGNPLTPGVTVLVPAFNEEPTIVETVRGLLGLRFPEFEVIVIDDGSTDNTFGRMQEEFDLVQIERVIPEDVPTIAPVNAVYAPRDGQQLLVIRKDNVGRRSDPMNVGINAASFPLVCMIDADSLLDESALLRVVKPFVDDPVNTVGSGGVIRAANGSEVASGRILDPRMPKGWVARIQVVEYLRSFLLGRTAWGRMSGLLILSGAFAMFRRDALVEVGGLDLHCLGEDAELVARLHHSMRKAKRGYRFVFVSEPVCWTEVPDTLKVLGRQRRRWSRGLAEVLWKHRSMMGNPKYGFIGMVVLPYYLVFELLGAVVELTGVFAVILGLIVGVVDVQFAAIFAVTAIGYGILLSFSALTVEEFSFHRYAAWKDLGAGLGAALLENVGFRQLHAWWRVRGLFNAITSTSKEWEDMPRSGYDEADVAGNAAALVAAGAGGAAR